MIYTFDPIKGEWCDSHEETKTKTEKVLNVKREDKRPFTLNQSRISPSIIKSPSFWNLTNDHTFISCNYDIGVNTYHV